LWSLPWRSRKETQARSGWRRGQRAAIGALRLLLVSCVVAEPEHARLEALAAADGKQVVPDLAREQGEVGQVLGRLVEVDLGALLVAVDQEDVGKLIHRLAADVPGGQPRAVLQPVPEGRVGKPVRPVDAQALQLFDVQGLAPSRWACLRLSLR